MARLNYCLIGDPKGKSIVDAKKEDIQLSGLYIWSRAFQMYGAGGTIDNSWRRDDLEQFDVVHINYTPSNLQLIDLVKQELKDSETKIVANVDLDIKYWTVNWGHHIHNMIRELKLADKVFHVEPVGADMIRRMIDRPVHTLPHPVDVTNMFDNIRNEREPVIGTIFHRYFPSTVIPYLVQRDSPLRRVLFGLMPIGKQPVITDGMFDQTIQYQNFKAHIEELSKCAIGCDLYEGFTYGRSVVEFAALGIPAITSSTVAASKQLFPETTCDPYDITKAKEILEKLETDQDFCDEVIKTANKNCSMYSLKQSYDRFVQMMEEVW